MLGTDEDRLCLENLFLAAFYFWNAATSALRDNLSEAVAASIRSVAEVVDIHKTGTASTLPAVFFPFLNCN